jgi:hypothetical protein
MQFWSIPPPLLLPCQRPLLLPRQYNNPRAFIGRGRRNRHVRRTRPPIGRPGENGGRRYLGLLVNALGRGFSFRSSVGVLLALLYVPPLLARIRAEEALLHAYFGAQYDAYRARTSRLIPGVY